MSQVVEVEVVEARSHSRVQPDEIQALVRVEEIRLEREKLRTQRVVYRWNVILRLGLAFAFVALFVL